jgi:hypothetical protein
MPYTVWSRGRLIGETDLDFFRLCDQSRSGSFHPNAEGERLMPVVASVLPAMRAYLHRDMVDALGDPFVQPALIGSTLFADLAEAVQHVHSLDFELRREDGSVVPTSDIGIQDTHQLIELPPLVEEDLDAENGDADDDRLEMTESDLQLVADVMRDAEATDQTLGALLHDSFPEWTPEDLPEHQSLRYQIHVVLLRGDAIP